MEIKLNIPEYSKSSGFKYSWEDGFVIKADVIDDSVTISANRAGLISLAKQLLTLAQETTPVGCHLHLDEYNSLEEGSLELMIEKII